jgi:hypothetical protein
MVIDMRGIIKKINRDNINHSTHTCNCEAIYFHDEPFATVDSRGPDEHPTPLDARQCKR